MELLSPCGKHWSTGVCVPAHAVLSREALICGETTVAIRVCFCVRNFARKRHMPTEALDRRNEWRRIILDLGATEVNGQVTRGQAMFKISLIVLIVPEVN